MFRTLLLAAPLAALVLAGADSRTNAADEENPIVKLIKSKVKDSRFRKTERGKFAATGEA